MIQVHVRSVRVTQDHTHLVLLIDQAESLVLAIEIGAPEARAIALALHRIRLPRPMSHDLLRNMLAHLAVRISHVVITELRGDTYVAAIHMRREGEDCVVDARPSDAIALAIRTKAPIYVAEPVAATAVRLERAFNDEDASAFKKFVEQIKPGDFAAGRTRDDQ